MSLLPLFSLGAVLMEAGMGRAKGALHCFVKGLAAFAVGAIIGGFTADERNALFCGTAALLATVGLSDRVTLTGAVSISFAIALAHQFVVLFDRLVSLASSFALPDPFSVLAGLHKVVSAYWLPDYAGVWSVHALAGGAALGALLVAGPRVGRYTRNGLPAPMPPHNLPLAGLGIFFVWVGASAFSAPLWLSASQTGAIAFLTALGWTRWRFGKTDPSFAFTAFWTGLIAGFVVGSAAPLPLLLAGILSGIGAVQFSVALDMHFVDDPVGIVAAEGLAPLIGLLVLWLSKSAPLGVGVLSWLLPFIGGFATASLVCAVLSRLGFLRPAPMDEFVGVDQRLYGIAAYPEFELREA